MAEKTLHFGKYKGRKVSECPVEYLDWLLDQEWLFEDLKEDIEQYLDGCAEYHRFGKD